MVPLGNHLNVWDYAVLITILAMIVAILIISQVRKQEEGILGYMLMGRRLTLPLFTATLVATWYGGIMGVTEIAFQHGLYNFITQGVFWYATYLLFALFLVGRVRAFQSVTLPELVGQQFGPISSKIAAVFNLFNVVPIAYVLSAGLIIEATLGIPLLWGMVASTALVTTYSLFGGFRSVVMTDLIQFACMCAAVAILLGFSIWQYGGWSYLYTNLPEAHFSVTGGNSIGTLFVWGFIALSTLVDPNFYQRCFAAKDTATARNGIFAATVIWCGFDLCTTFGAMYAAAVLPDVSASQGYLSFGIQTLPHGLKGFFLAGILCTVISTMDSYIFIAGNCISYDLLPARFHEKIGLHRLGICAVGIIAVLMALVFDGSVKDVWKTLGSYSAGCLLVPMLAAYVWPGRFSDRHFIGATIPAALAITYWRWTEHNGFWANVDDLYLGLVFSIFGLAVTQIKVR